MLDSSSSLLVTDQEQVSALVQHPRNFVGMLEGESISSRDLQLGCAKWQC